MSDDQLLTNLAGGREFRIVPDKVLKDELQDSKVRFRQPLQQLAELQDLDTSIWHH